MDVKASAGRHAKGASYFEHCESLSLKAGRLSEAQWMGALARVLTMGGELEIRPRGRDPVVVEFVDSFAPPPVPPAQAAEDRGEAES